MADLSSRCRGFADQILSGLPESSAVRAQMSAPFLVTDLRMRESVSPSSMVMICLRRSDFVGCVELFLPNQWPYSTMPYGSQLAAKTFQISSQSQRRPKSGCELRHRLFVEYAENGISRGPRQMDTRKSMRRPCNRTRNARPADSALGDVEFAHILMRLRIVELMFAPQWAHGHLQPPSMRYFTTPNVICLN